MNTCLEIMDPCAAYFPITNITVFNHIINRGLTQRDLSDLIEDIKVYMELEQGKNTEYWQVQYERQVDKSRVHWH